MNIQSYLVVIVIYCLLIRRTTLRKLRSKRNSEVSKNNCKKDIDTFLDVVLQMYNNLKLSHYLKLGTVK